MPLLLALGGRMIAGQAMANFCDWLRWISVLTVRCFVALNVAATLSQWPSILRTMHSIRVFKIRCFVVLPVQDECCPSTCCVSATSFDSGLTFLILFSVGLCVWSTFARSTQVCVFTRFWKFHPKCNRQLSLVLLLWTIGGFSWSSRCFKEAAMLLLKGAAQHDCKKCDVQVCIDQDTLVQHVEERLMQLVSVLSGGLH